MSKIMLVNKKIGYHQEIKLRSLKMIVEFFESEGHNAEDFSLIKHGRQVWKDGKMHQVKSVYDVPSVLLARELNEKI